MNVKQSAMKIIVFQARLKIYIIQIFKEFNTLSLQVVSTQFIPCARRRLFHVLIPHVSLMWCVRMRLLWHWQYLLTTNDWLKMFCSLSCSVGKSHFAQCVTKRSSCSLQSSSLLWTCACHICWLSSREMYGMMHFWSLPHCFQCFQWFDLRLCLRCEGLNLCSFCFWHCVSAGTREETTPLNYRWLKALFA